MEEKITIYNEEKERKYLYQLIDQDITLEESVKLYEDGLKNIKEAQKLIEEAQLKIEVIEKEMIGISQ